jgi:hypothetical protein
VTTTIIVLFNLKAGASPTAYEDWARKTDIPTVRALKSNAGFEVFKTVSVRGSDRAPPYQYVELISIADMDQFGADVATETMKKVAGEFREFADGPLFVVAEKIEP